MARPKSASKPIAVSPAVDPGTGFVTVNIFDGTRQLMKQGTQILLTIRDGAQNQLFRDDVTGPSVKLALPFHNNFADNYSIVAFVDGYEQAGFQPVAISPNAPRQLDLMLLPKTGSFHFAGARWSDILSQKPLLGLRHMTSGFCAAIHASTRGSRRRIELTLYVAIFIVPLIVRKRIDPRSRGISLKVLTRPNKSMVTPPSHGFPCRAIGPTL